MHAVPLHRLGARPMFAASVAAVLAALGWWEPVTLLVSAPWLAALAWLLIRLGPHAVAPGNAEPVPSAAELHLRRR